MAIWKFKHDRGGDTSALSVSITVDGRHGVIGQNGIAPASGFPDAAIDSTGNLKAFDGTTFSDFVSGAARPGIDPDPDTYRLTVRKGGLPISSITFQPVLASPTAAELDINALVTVGKALTATPEQLINLAQAAALVPQMTQSLADSAQAATLAVAAAGILPRANLAAITGADGYYRAMDTGYVYQRSGGATTRRPDLEAASGSAVTGLQSAIRNTAPTALATLSITAGAQFADGARFTPVTPSQAAAQGITADGGAFIQATDGLFRREFSGSFNATWYGADPTGVIDSTLAIQKAMDAAYAAGGGSVFLPRGTYTVGARIVSNGAYLENYLMQPRNGVDLYGEGGNSTVLKLMDHLLDQLDDQKNAHIFSANNLQNVLFRGFTIDANGANNLTPSGHLRNALAFRLYGGGYNVRWNDVEVRNLSGHNVFSLGGNGKNARFRDVRVVNGGPWVGVANPYNSDFSAGYSEWDNTLVTGCNFATDPTQTTRFCGGFELHGSASSVSDSYFQGYYPGVYMSDKGGYPSSGQRCTNNEMVDCYKGVVFAITTTGYKNAIVQGNTMQLYKAAGNTDAGQPTGVTYTAGGRSSGGVFGLSAANNSKLENVILSDNTIYANPAQVATYQHIGFDLHSLWDVKITRNTVKNLGGYGMLFRGSVWGDAGVRVRDNDFIDLCQNPALLLANRTGILLGQFGDSPASGTLTLPDTTTVTSAFFVRDFLISGNRYRNRLAPTFGGSGTLLSQSSAGQMWAGVTLVGVGAPGVAQDIVVEDEGVTNVSHRVQVSGNSGNSYKWSSVSTGYRYVPNTWRSPVKSMTDVQLYPGDTVQYGDGSRATFGIANGPSFQTTLSGITTITTAGSDTLTVAGTDIAKLRPGMFVQIAGAGNAGGTMYQFIRRVISLTQIQMESVALTAQGGGALTNYYVQPTYQTPQAASAATAAVAAGATPTKAEFDAVLAELRAFETAVKNGGVLT